MALNKILDGFYIHIIGNYVTVKSKELGFHINMDDSHKHNIE